MLDTAIKVKTDQFDGPLGLLLMLIQKEEMNIRDLDITIITKQYLDYIAKMDELNFDVAGDYLYLAATLLLLKSTSCITEEEEKHLKDFSGENDFNIPSQSELVRRLEELRHFQKIGEKLWELPKTGHEIFLKPKVDRKAVINSILLPMDLEKLTLSMIDLIRREKRKYTVVKRERLTIKEKLNFLKEFLQEGQQLTLNELVSSHGKEGTDNIVITFISILELARLKMIKIFQTEAGKTVYVEVLQNLDCFDVNAADGFDEENANLEEPIEAINHEQNKLEQDELGSNGLIQ